MNFSTEKEERIYFPKKLNYSYFCICFFVKQVFAIIHKEFRLEFRQRATLSGILLYLIGCVYLCYLVIRKITVGPDWKLREIETWNSLFWILLLFNAIIATSKTFANDSKGRMLYYYSLYHPRNLLIAKLIYNFLLLTIISLLCYFFFAVFIGNPVKNLPVFLTDLFLSCIAFAGILTMTSGIAAKAGGGFTLISILSIPLLFPMLLMAIRSSMLACLGYSFSSGSVYLFGLLALSVLIVSLGVLLFPYLWRE